MTRKWLYLVMLFILMALLACAPKPAAVPSAPAPQPTAPAATLPTAATSQSPEDVAWSRVVEAAKKEGKVTAYSFNMTGDVGLAVAKGFQGKYGIKLDIITGGGAALAERIKVEKRMGGMVADVMDANTLQTGNIKDVGATMGAEDLPALQEKGVWLVEPWANDPQRHKLIHTVVYYTPGINTSQIKSGDEPRSLKELAQPKWKGKMTGWDPRQQSVYYNYFLPLLKRKLLDQDTLQAIGMNDVAWTASFIDSVQNTIRGQYPLYLGSVSSFFPLVAMEPSLPIKPMNLEEGIVASNLAIALIKESPHPNSAKLFVNWLFTQEGQDVIAKANARLPVRKDVPDYSPASLRMTPTRLIVVTGEEEAEEITLFREGWLAKLWGR